METQEIGIPEDDQDLQLQSEISKGRRSATSTWSDMKVMGKRQTTIDKFMSEWRLIVVLFIKSSKDRFINNLTCI